LLIRNELAQETASEWQMSLTMWSDDGNTPTTIELLVQ